MECEPRPDYDSRSDPFAQPLECSEDQVPATYILFASSAAPSYLQLKLLGGE